MTSANAAIWYAQDGFDPKARGINGRRVAGESFLRGFLRHATVDEFVFLSKSAQDVDPVRALVPNCAQKRRCVTPQCCVPTASMSEQYFIPARISPPRLGGARLMAQARGRFAE